MTAGTFTWDGGHFHLGRRALSLRTAGTFTWDGGHFYIRLDTSKVYRGVGGFRLPDAFLAPDEFDVRGGVEFGFMSATVDRAVAVTYASYSKGRDHTTR